MNKYINCVCVYVCVCVCLCLCVCLHAGEGATELKLHTGMKARGNFNIKRDVSEKAF